MSIDTEDAARRIDELMRGYVAQVNELIGDDAPQEGGPPVTPDPDDDDEPLDPLLTFAGAAVHPIERDKVVLTFLHAGYVPEGDSRIAHLVETILHGIGAYLPDLESVPRQVVIRARREGDPL